MWIRLNRILGAQIFIKSEQVSIGIGNDELSITTFKVALPVSVVLQRHYDLKGRQLHSIEESDDIRNNDLQIYPSRKRALKRCCAEASPWAKRALEHQMCLANREIGERLLAALGQNFKTENALIDSQ